MFLKQAKNLQKAFFLSSVGFPRRIVHTELSEHRIYVLFLISCLLAESDVVREGERIVKSGIIRLTAIRDIIDRASYLIYELITQCLKLKYNLRFPI